MKTGLATILLRILFYPSAEMKLTKDVPANIEGNACIDFRNTVYNPMFNIT